MTGGEVGKLPKVSKREARGRTRDADRMRHQLTGSRDELFRWAGGVHFC